jgi:hypothetical protein
MKAVILFFLFVLATSCSESPGIEIPSEDTKIKKEIKEPKLKEKKKKEVPQKDPELEKRKMKHNLEHIQMQQNEINNRLKNLDKKLKKYNKLKKRKECNGSNTCLVEENK